MTKADLARLALELPIDERLDLAQTLWDSASPPDDFEATPALRKLLDARLREAEANPEGGITWEAVKARSSSADEAHPPSPPSEPTSTRRHAGMKSVGDARHPFVWRRRR